MRMSSHRGIVVVGQRWHPGLPHRFDIDHAHTIASRMGFLRVTPIEGSDHVAAFMIAPIAEEGFAAESLERYVKWLERIGFCTWFEYALGPDPEPIAITRSQSHAAETEEQFNDRP